jgi:hypothetical protein
MPCGCSAALWRVASSPSGSNFCFDRCGLVRTQSEPSHSQEARKEGESVGFLKKTLAVTTLGGSVAAEKAAKLAAGKVADARSEEAKTARAEKKSLDD